MWGSLTCPMPTAAWPSSTCRASTSQDWTRWDNQTQSALVEYTHALSADWEAKSTLNHAETQGETKLFYAYTATGYLNDDNTGLLGWPYRSDEQVQQRHRRYPPDRPLSGLRSRARRDLRSEPLAPGKQDLRLPGATFPVLPAFPYARRRVSRTRLGRPHP